MKEDYIELSVETIVFNWLCFMKYQEINSLSKQNVLSEEEFLPQGTALGGIFCSEPGDENGQI